MSSSLEDVVLDPMALDADPDVADGVYSNAATVHFGEHELVIDFLYLYPRRDGGRLKARVVLHPEQARAVERALHDALAAHAAHFRGSAPAPAPRPSTEGRMEPEDAVAIARRHLEGRVKVGADAILHVETTPSHFIIEWRPTLGPHTRGPDYDAHVEVDRVSGQVTSFLVGS